MCWRVFFSLCKNHVVLLLAVAGFKLELYRFFDRRLQDFKRLGFFFHEHINDATARDNTKFFCLPILLI